MKKVFSLTTVMVMTCLMVSISACSNKLKYDLTAKLTSLQQAEQRYEKLDSAAKEKSYQADMDTLFRDIKAGVKDYNQQGLCAQGDWAIRLPECNDQKEGFLSKAQDIYNVFAAFNAIWSDYEIWCRAENTGNCVLDSAVIVSSIKSLNAECIKDEGMQKVVSLLRDSVVQAIMHPDSNGQGAATGAAHLWQYMVDNHLNKKGDECFLDTSIYHKLQMLDVDSVKTAAYMTACKGDEGFWKDIIGEQDFNKRCQLTLMAMHGKHETRWVQEAAMALMQSGEYSPLLPRLWRSWRCLAQCYHYGPSRDSIIPNNTFNRYRKMAYKSVIDYLLEHPEDKQAKAAAAAIFIRTDLIRNGDFMLGSDCLPECFEMGLLE